MTLAALALACLICLLAGILTGLTGFGFSVLSVPLLLLVAPPQQVVAVALALVPVTSAVLLTSKQLRQEADLKTAAKLIALSVIGLPLGILLFEAVDPLWVIALMGIVLTLYAAWSLAKPGQLSGDGKWLVPSGVLGGILTTSTGLNGPAVAIYIHGRNMSSAARIGTMAVYVGGISALGIGALVARGAVSVSDLATIALATPGAACGTLIGRWWGLRVHERLDQITLIALLLMGLWSIIRAMSL